MPRPRASRKPPERVAPDDVAHETHDVSPGPVPPPIRIQYAEVSERARTWTVLVEGTPVGPVTDMEGARTVAVWLSGGGLRDLFQTWQ